MKTLFLGLFLFAIAMLYVKSKQGKSTTNLPKFFPKNPLSDPEQVLFHRLEAALPKHIVLAQVQLTQFISIKRGPLYKSWFNKISQKNVDFLVCAHDFSITAAIELDDRSHDSVKRKLDDTNKTTAINAAGIELVRWRVNALPSIEEIQARFDELSNNRQQ